MDDLHIPESQPVDSIVYQLKALDRFNESRKFAYHMTGEHFRVGELSGEVRLIKPLDREQMVKLTVMVGVLDTSDSKSEPVEFRRRYIYVDDIDDSWPTFAAPKESQSSDQSTIVYHAEVSEIAPIGSLVLSDIQVSDADEGQNAEMIFECRLKRSTRGSCDAFSVDSRRLSSGRYSVSIRIKSPLDFERTSSYRLALVAKGKRPSPLKGVPLETEAFVDIQLTNVQDENPIFLNAPYSLSLKEGAREGTRLLNLLVQDGDSAPQRDLSVIVAPGQFSDYFQVSKDPELANLWYLETKSVIDREDSLISQVGNIFNISLLAAELDESARPVASDLELETAIRDYSFSRGSLKRENVTIFVLDALDSRPTFVRASSGVLIGENSLVLNVSEAIGTGASVPNLDLAVVDLDQGVNSRFNLSLIDSNAGPSASLALELESTVIYGRSEVVLNVLNSSLLDYEDPRLRVYKFNLVASKSLNPSLIQTLEVQLNLVDANDNSPQFDRSQYVLNVNEDAQPGTLVGTIKATDRDSGPNGRLEYILRGPGASKFKLLGDEGKILLEDCGLSQCLDHELQQSYSLIYEARDGGGRVSNVSIIINIGDINDHAPKFSESVYRRELISDNLSSRQNYISPQLLVRARDLDGGSSGRGNVSYRVKSTNLTGLDVDPISGLVYLSQPIDLDSLISRIDTSSRILFEAEIEAQDGGNPPLVSSARVQLTVRGNNDGAPRFKQNEYDAKVTEDQPIHRSFIQVQAVDPDEKDSQLRYSLGDDLNDLLQINSQTGEISFKRKTDSEDLKTRPYNVTVYATDSSKPHPLKASASLRVSLIDVNNKPPKFEQREYKSTLVEGRSKSGDILIQLRAHDPDKSAKLSYSIEPDRISMNDRNGLEFSVADLSNTSSNVYLSQLSKADGAQLASQLRSLFAINKTSGAIELRSEPDYSLAASISLVVRVVDSAASSADQSDFAV